MSFDNVAPNDLVLIAGAHKECETHFGPSVRWMSRKSTLLQRRCGLKLGSYPQDDCFLLVLVSPVVQRILVEDRRGKFRLPLISIPRWSRPGLSLHSEIKSRFAFDVVIVDILDDVPKRSNIVVAVMLEPGRENNLSCMNHWVPLNEIAADELGGSDRECIECLLRTGSTGRGPFSRMGWFAEVVEWVAEATSLDPSQLRLDFEQYNASPSSALIRFSTKADRSYWFKADLKFFGRELQITAALSSLFPEHLPQIVASQEKWGAWLSKDAGQPLDRKETIGRRRTEQIVRTLANLHLNSVPYTETLKKSGCSDQRLTKVSQEVCALGPYLQAALDAGRSIAPSTISGGRLCEILRRVEEADFSIGSLNIPDTLVHNHLNLGNIVIGKGGPLFIDWGEAGIGNPLVNFGQLWPQLTTQKTIGLREPRLAEAYRRVWGTIIDQEEFSHAMDFIPLAALATHLYSRKNWILTSREPGIEIQSALVSLLDEMDRAARIFEIRQTRKSEAVKIRPLRGLTKHGAA